MDTLLGRTGWSLPGTAIPFKAISIGVGGCEQCPCPRKLDAKVKIVSDGDGQQNRLHLKTAIVDEETQSIPEK
jgi:hypothetical protein